MQLASTLLERHRSDRKRNSAWQQQLAQSAWLEPGATYYFLARGASLASGYGAQLLWEEGVKVAASQWAPTAFATGRRRS